MYKPRRSQRGNTSRQGTVGIGSPLGLSSWMSWLPSILTAKAIEWLCQLLCQLLCQWLIMNHILYLYKYNYIYASMYIYMHIYMFACVYQSWMNSDLNLGTTVNHVAPIRHPSVHCFTSEVPSALNAPSNFSPRRLALRSKQISAKGGKVANDLKQMLCMWLPCCAGTSWNISYYLSNEGWYSMYIIIHRHVYLFACPSFSGHLYSMRITSHH